MSRTGAGSWGRMKMLEVVVVVVVGRTSDAAAVNEGAKKRTKYREKQGKEDGKATKSQDPTTARRTA